MRPAGTTDTGRGRDRLIVRHVATYLGDELLPGGGDSVSGLTLGTSSASNDTVLGPSGAHRLIIDPARPSLRLDGGPHVPYTGSEADLAVPNEFGDVVHLDVRNLIAGYSGVIDLRAEGTLSTDGGASETPITYASSQRIADTETGAVTHLDTSLIRRAGEDLIEYEGTGDVLTTLIDLASGLRGAAAGNELDKNTLTDVLKDFDRLLEELSLAQARVGSEAERAVNLVARFEEQDLGLQGVISEVAGVDLTEAIATLTRAQGALEIAQQVAARILQNSQSAFLR